MKSRLPFLLTSISFLANALAVGLPMPPQHLYDAMGIPPPE